MSNDGLFGELRRGAGVHRPDRLHSLLRAEVLDKVLPIDLGASDRRGP
jgi:hypothetical protein